MIYTFLMTVGIYTAIKRQRVISGSEYVGLHPLSLPEEDSSVFTHAAMPASSGSQKINKKGKSQQEEAERALCGWERGPFQAVFPQRRAPDRGPDCGNSRWCRGPDGPGRPH